MSKDIVEEKSINLVVENLENILNNPANNHLPISVMQVIETSVRLLKVESSQLTAYKEALREIIEAFSYIVPNYEANHVSGLYNAIYNTDILIKEKAKTLTE